MIIYWTIISSCETWSKFFSNGIYFRMIQEQFKMNGCKVNSICIWMPITRQDHSPSVEGMAAVVHCMDGISVQVLMLWLKSFLEQQVLFTVKLTAGACSARPLISMEARVWITVHTLSGKENCSAGSPLVAGFSILLGRACSATKWEARKRKILYATEPASTSEAHNTMEHTRLGQVE